ncbi:hypothetical protein CBR_g38205 [Chara braunii]|uniref:Uncharacterized protein n=1 Tax=Chara braunii TaxID=69332 RepID=A0A388LPK7_CHABU|nr:hypothetical protein CBR_g38205 [Chara braunii]|eukprot:GBG84234.1 hypothetical protein CBR_g38205 [Chara braunii]
MGRRVSSLVMVALVLGLLVVLGSSGVDGKWDKEFRRRLRKRIVSDLPRRRAGEGGSHPKLEEFVQKLKMGEKRNPNLGKFDMGSVLIDFDDAEMGQTVRPGRGLRSDGEGDDGHASVEYRVSNSEVSFDGGFFKLLQDDKDGEGMHAEDSDSDAEDNEVEVESDSEEADGDNDVVVTVKDGSKNWQFRRSGSAGRSKFVKEGTLGPFPGTCCSPRIH